MKRFFCFGKQGYCHYYDEGAYPESCPCGTCEHTDGRGGEYRECDVVSVSEIMGVVGDYDIKRLCDLVQADRDGRCVVFAPGHAIVKNYAPKDEDGLYTMTASGVVSEEEYETAVKG